MKNTECSTIHIPPFSVTLDQFSLTFYLKIAAIFIFENCSYLRGSTTQNWLIFQFCFFMFKIKLCVCRNLCENFRQIGQKMKKL